MKPSTIRCGVLPTAISLLVMLLAACSSDTPPVTAVPALAVRVAPVLSGPALPRLHASGVLASRDKALLSFKVGGVIRAIHVVPGERVHAGRLLAELDSTEIDAATVQARQAHAKAARDLQRGRSLFAEDVLSREQLDDLLTAEAVAAAQLRAAEFNRGHARIVATGDGTVLRTLAEPRETVAPGVPILELASGARGWVLQASVADRDAVTLAVGDPATVRLDALPDQAFQGQVIELGAAADPRTGSFPLQISLDHPPDDSPLASGLFGSADILRRAGDARTLSRVPLEALVEGSSQDMLIFLCDADCTHAIRRQVEIAFIDDAHAALRDELPAGTRVITRGASYLHDGDAIRMVD